MQLVQVGYISRTKFVVITVVKALRLLSRVLFVQIGRDSLWSLTKTPQGVCYLLSQIFRG